MRLLLTFIPLIFLMNVAFADTFRSVRMIISNDTGKPLAIEGYDTADGTWKPGQGPQEGATLNNGETKSFVAVSNTIGMGTGGFIDLSGPHGIVSIRWNQPWTGPVDINIESKEPFSVERSKSGEPDNVVFVIDIK